MENMENMENMEKMEKMEKNYSLMSDADLEELLRKPQGTLEEAEDDLEILQGRSQSGQHISGSYIQSRFERIERKIAGFHGVIAEINKEIQSRISKRKD